MANGCFWCAEADMEKIEGVVLVTSGYAGGMGENPTYDDYGGNGFREVVEITYDPTQVSYSNLVESLIKHGDPTDAEGSFYLTYTSKGTRVVNFSISMTSCFAFSSA